MVIFTPGWRRNRSKREMPLEYTKYRRYEHPENQDESAPDWEEKQMQLDDAENKKIANECTIELKCAICNKPVCHFSQESVGYHWIMVVCFDCSNTFTPDKEVRR
jgi:hypothetical protein